MKLNDMPCLNYTIGTDTAVVTVSSTDVAEIQALNGKTDLMIYDGTDNPLIALTGFDHVISIRLLTDSGSSEITFGRSDTRVSELEQTATALRASLDDLAKKNQDAVASLAAIVKKQDDVSSALAALQKTSDSFTSKFDALSKVSLLKAVLGGGS